MMRNFDLNDPAPSDDVNTNLELGLPSVPVMANQNTNNDEVTIISRRHSGQVSNRSRRNQRMIRNPNVGYERRHTASQSNNNNILRTVHSTQVNDGLYHVAQREDYIVKYEDVPEAPPPVQQRASMFSCPICMEEVVEETSTKCGHIFCKRCIVEALTNERKCPICRRKLRIKDIFRIYLSNNGR